MRLSQQQSQIRRILEGFGKGFLRISRDHGALLVSDLPRHTPWRREWNASLENIGWTAWLSEETGLLLLDFAPDRWREMAFREKPPLPDFPEKAADQALYQLLRLTFLHDGENPPGEEERPFLRQCVKLEALGEKERQTEIQRLLTKVALCLRERQPVPRGAYMLLRENIPLH